MLVIADAQKVPSAVAGVMGGEFSGIYDDTTTIVFECAMLQRRRPCASRPKSWACAPRPPAALKKGWTPTAACAAVDRACELVQLLDAGDVVNGVVDVWVAQARRAPQSPCAWMR